MQQIIQQIKCEGIKDSLIYGFPHQRTQPATAKRNDLDKNGAFGSNAHPMFWAKIKPAVISAFIVLNLGTVLFMNRPGPVVQVTDDFLDKLSPLAAYRFSYAGWLIAEYAHKSGLDNRWQMFGRQSRFNWWFLIKAKTDAGTIDLPLPLQSPRTFWQRTFFDYKEAKFHLNLYANQPLREAYAAYLCRQYSLPGHPPIRSIIFELHYQNLLSPADAAKYGRHTELESYTQVWDEFPSSP